MEFLMKNVIMMFLTVSFLFLSGCKDESNPVEQEEHFDPEGWLFEDLSGNPVLVVWQAVIQPEWNNVSVQDGFRTGVNENLELRVRFLNSDRGVMEYPGDPDYSLGYLITDNSILMISVPESNNWKFTITGLAAGSTTVEMRVLHGGHADAITPLIPVHVN
jgi:hypothetical protein